MTAQKPAQFDEMLAPDGSVRDAYTAYQQWLSEQDVGWMRRKGAEAESFFRRTGITFNVYGDDAATERLIPFDIIPRILSAAEWRRLAAGIEQRVRALNAFMYDIYHRQEIIRAGRIPEDLIIQNVAFLPETGALFFKSCNYADSGEYRCVVNSERSKLDSGVVRLFVQGT